VYNGERFLPDTIKSILGQTHADFELIISDNASSDRTEEICSDFVAMDRRIHYHRAPVNQGATSNYRRAFELATSTYFKWQNADDVIGSQFLERCIEVLERDKAVVLAYPKTRLIDQNGGTLSDFHDDLHLTSSSPCSRFIAVIERLGMCNAIYGVFRRDAVARTDLMGPFFSSDRVFMAEIALQGRFHEVPEVLFFRRLHEDAYSSQKDPARLLEFYHPAKKKKIVLFWWRLVYEYSKAVRRAPVRLPEKRRAYQYVLKMAKWHWHDLLDEAASAGKLLIGRKVGLRGLDPRRRASRKIRS
jgi:glycosyltransferase involved in cell wall biosynthesis